MQQWRFIDNPNQLDMFQATILPIFRSTRLYVTACGIMYPRCCRPVAWKRSLQATGQQHRRCFTPQAVTQSLVLLKMGKIIARNILSCLGLSIKPLLLHRVGCLYYLSLLHIFAFLKRIVLKKKKRIAHLAWRSRRAFQKACDNNIRFKT